MRGPTLQMRTLKRQATVRALHEKEKRGAHANTRSLST